MKTAIITGVTGQDGAYLSKLLLEKNYTVVGLIRNNEPDLWRLEYLNISDAVKLYKCDLGDYDDVFRIISEIMPSEFYNLAAQSSVGHSFKDPIATLTFNTLSVINILEAIRKADNTIRFYQASSSEMFGMIDQLPIDEDSKFHPVSPYAISKVTGHYTTINYRESYHLYACCGILFNHESYLRGSGFFVKKVITGALNIAKGNATELSLGNIDLKRDFGSAKRYVEAMWMMLQQDIPNDYVICSGQSVHLRDIVHYVFKRLKVPLYRLREDPQLIRPNDITDIYGCSAKAKHLLGWDYSISFFDILDEIIDEEVRNYESARG